MKKINENTKVTLTLKQLKRLVKESDGEKDSKGIVLWHDFDRISAEEFADKVHKIEQELEDMLIQNAEVYASADDPWQMFEDDLTEDGKYETLEEALGLDFCVHQSAKGKLPESISKYFIFPISFRKGRRLVQCHQVRA